MIEPDWPAPARVRALVTTRPMGDMAGAGRDSLSALVPSEPAWLTQVHGVAVSEIDSPNRLLKADAAMRSIPVILVTAKRVCGGRGGLHAGVAHG